MTTFHEVASFIAQASDSEIRAIYDLCKVRTKTLRSVATIENLATFKVGDNVVIRDLSPRYLNGMTGTVVNLHGRKTGSVLVRLDHAVGRFTTITPVGIPASSLTLA